MLIKCSSCGCMVEEGDFCWQCRKVGPGEIFHSKGELIKAFVQCKGCSAIYEYPTSSVCPSCKDARWLSMREDKKIDKFNTLLQKMKEIHDSKRKDYAGEDPLENFTRASVLNSWFTNDTDKVYATLIGIKLARLANLLSNNQTPNNESIEDTFIDLANYVLIWGTWRIR